MRNTLFIILVLIGLVSCNSGNESSKPLIAVSIVPQKYLVESIADTLVDVVVMVPPGASPATWEATPAQMQSLADALVYFRIGHIGFEKAWIAKIRELNPDIPMVDLSVDIQLLGIDYQHGDHSHTGIDPHIWMSPKNMETMARVVYGELQKLFPEQKDYLKGNYEKLMREIKETDAYAKRTMAPYKGKTFMIFHPALGYFANDYGLVQESIEYEGKEPSPAHMKEIIDIANNKDIRLIFVQQEFDKRNAQIVAEQIGGQIISINPLSENWPNEIKSICNNLVKNYK